MRYKLDTSWAPTSCERGERLSKISPTDAWKIPRTLHQQFVKDCFALWGFGEGWGTRAKSLSNPSQIPDTEYVWYVCLFAYIFVIFSDGKCIGKLYQRSSVWEWTYPG